MDAGCGESERKRLWSGNGRENERTQGEEMNKD